MVGTIMEDAGVDAEDDKDESAADAEDTEDEES